MADSKHIKSVAIIGAGGQVGSKIVELLLASNNPRIQITAITRDDSTSTSTLPTSSQITVAKGSYQDSTFLTQAMKGQDALVITLGFMAPPGLYSTFIKAAADAKVPYILPTEFGSDTSRQSLLDAVPMLKAKASWRAEIEQLGVSSWIAIITNPWFDFGMKHGIFGIDIKARKAVIYDNGNVKVDTTMMATASVAAAKVLSLPISAPAGQPSLQSYKNKFVYVHSFSATQNEMLESIQRVTGKDGWQVSNKSTDELIQEGKTMVDAGDHNGNFALLTGNSFKLGVGADFSGPLANEALGLAEEDIDDAVRKVIQEI